MMIVGLTGSIGMGKSTAAKMLRQMGVPVYDADAAVHACRRRAALALPPIEAAFPGVVKDGVLDRQALGAARVRQQGSAAPARGHRASAGRASEQRAFLKRAAQRGEKLVVLDIPLLFEGVGERRVDATLVVSAPAFLQRHARDGPARHDGRAVRRHPAPAGAGRAEAAKGHHRDPDRAWAWRRRGWPWPRRSRS